ncbi:unnamed protein product [Brassica napus]|uniref:(rape) hypothetical protein n=1 Tax=Brassica napus TaxID=3708 RepID=A0A816I313_BRANA|nr:unnamed protein product [Brassica napus]
MLNVCQSGSKTCQTMDMYRAASKEASNAEKTVGNIAVILDRRLWRTRYLGLKLNQSHLKSKPTDPTHICYQRDQVVHRVKSSNVQVNRFEARRSDGQDAVRRSIWDAKVMLSSKESRSICKPWDCAKQCCDQSGGREIVLCFLHKMWKVYGVSVVCE